MYDIQFRPCFKQQIIKRLDAASRLAAKAKETASHSVCRPGAMRHASDLKFDLALVQVSRDLKKLNLIFCRLSNRLFLNLGATCFCSEWQARANRLQLPKAQDCEWATFPVALLRASPPSQPPSLPKFISGISLPTSVSTAVYCQMLAFGTTFVLVHWILRRILS